MVTYDCMQVTVLYSLSLAWHLGMSVLRAHASKQSTVEAVLGVYQEQGRLLFTGKVVDVVRITSQGFARGHVVLQELQQPAMAALHNQSTTPTGRQLQAGTDMPQSAYPSAADTSTVSAAGSAATDRAPAAVQPVSQASCSRMVLEFQNENLIAKLDDVVMACVPDIITCMEVEGGAAVATEELRYGLHISVIALPAHPLLRTPDALAVVGPSAFGYPDVSYTAVGEFPKLMPVHHLYRQRH